MLPTGAGALMVGAAIWITPTLNDTGETSIHSRTPDSHPGSLPNHPSASPTAARRKLQAASPATIRAAQLEEIHRLLASSKPVAHGQLRNDEVIKLLHRLAELDPAAALDYAERHPELHGQADLTIELFAGWLDRNELSARDWLDAVPAGVLRIQLVPVVVSHLASELPEEALALAGELPGYDGELGPLPAFGNWDHSDELEGQARERAYAAVFREWASSDPVAAAARAGALEDPLYRNLALQEVGLKWILKDPAAAIQWSKELPAGPDQYSALQGIMAEWTTHDPRAAASFLAALEDSPHRDQWLRLLGENWTACDPRMALSWAAQLPDETDRTQTVRTVLATVLESGGREAADFVLTLPAGSSREQGMELVLPKWSADDAEGVRAWLAELPHDSLREEAMEFLSRE